MIKNIKFFIQVNGYSIRSLGELEEQFHLQDVLALYRKGVLLRWLIAHNFEEKRHELELIPSGLSDIEAAKALIEIFCPHLPKESIQESIYPLLFLEEQKKQIETVHDSEEKWDKIINGYHDSYLQLKNDIFEHAFDFPFLSEASLQLVNKYWKLVELEEPLFSNTMFEMAPGIFFSLLSFNILNDNIKKKATTHINKCLCSNIESEDAAVSLLLKGVKKDIVSQDRDALSKGSLTFIKKTTHESWDDIIQETERKILVLYLGKGDFVRSRITREELDSDTVNSNFPILDGLDYKGLRNSPLVYMDVTELLKRYQILSLKNINS